MTIQYEGQCSPLSGGVGDDLRKATQGLLKYEGCAVS